MTRAAWSAQIIQSLLVNSLEEKEALRECLMEELMGEHGDLNEAQRGAKTSAPRLGELQKRSPNPLPTEQSSSPSRIRPLLPQHHRRDDVAEGDGLLLADGSPPYGGADFQQPLPNQRMPTEPRGACSDAVRFITLPTICNQVQCTESFPLLEDGVKRRKPPHTHCRGMGMDMPNRSLSRAAAMTHSAVEEMSQEPLIGNLQWCCTPFFESFGIKDFFREGPISMSRWLQGIGIGALIGY